MLMLTDRRKPYYVCFRLSPTWGFSGQTAIPPRCALAIVSQSRGVQRKILHLRNSRQQTRHQRQHQDVDQILTTGQKALLSMEDLTRQAIALIKQQYRHSASLVSAHGQTHYSAAERRVFLPFSSREARRKTLGKIFPDILGMLCLACGINNAGGCETPGPHVRKQQKTFCPYPSSPLILRPGTVPCLKNTRRGRWKNLRS